MKKVLEQIQRSKGRITNQPLPQSDDFKPSLLLSNLKSTHSEVNIPESKDYLDNWQKYLKNRDERILDKRTLGVLSFDSSISLSTTYLKIVERQKSIPYRQLKGLLYSLQKTYGSKRGCTKIMTRIFEKLDAKQKSTAPFVYCKDLLNNRLAETFGKELLKNTSDLKDSFNSERLVVNSPFANASILSAAEQLSDHKEKLDSEVLSSFMDLLLFKPKDKELLNGLLNIAIPRLMSGNSNEATSLLRYILSHEQYGDPRVNSSKWTGIDEGAKKLTHSHLPHNDINFFFTLISHDKSTRSRKKFWLKYTDQITKSFVFLSNKHLKEKNQVLTYAKKEHGYVFGRTRKGDISILILDLGGLIAVEFSEEDYPCYLYQKRYFPDLLPDFFSGDADSIDHLDNLEFSGSDFGSEKGYWQSHTEGWQRELGLYLASHGIMPNFLDRS